MEIIGLGISGIFVGALLIACEVWDVTTEFPEWCNMCFGGYLWEDFLNDDEYSRAVKLMG